MLLNSFEGSTEILGGERRVSYMHFDDGTASLSLVVKDEAEAHAVIAFLESKRVSALWAHVHPVAPSDEAAGGLSEDVVAKPEVIKRTRRRRVVVEQKLNGGHTPGAVATGLFEKIDGESLPAQPSVVTDTPKGGGGLLDETVRKIEAETAADTDDPEWMRPEEEAAAIAASDEPPVDVKPAPKPKRAAAKPKASAEPAIATPVEDDAPPVDVGDVPEKLVGAKRLIEVITYLQEQGATDAVSIMKGVHDLRPKVPLLNRIPAEQLAERVKRTLEMYGG